MKKMFAVLLLAVVFLGALVLVIVLRRRKNQLRIVNDEA